MPHPRQYLSAREAQVYELIKTGLGAGQIVAKLGWQQSSIYGIIGRLIQMQVIERRKHGRKIVYVALVGHYDTIPNEQELFKIRRTLMQGGEPYIHIELTEAMREKLHELYETTTRKRLAAILGIPRYVLNRELIRLGLERKE